MVNRTLETEVLLRLSRPVNPFHGDHWYQMCEYYLGRRQEVQSFLHPRNSIDSVHLLLAMESSRISRMLTPFTFFLVVLTVWIPQLRRVSIIHIPKNSLRALEWPKQGSSLSLEFKVTHTVDLSHSSPDMVEANSFRYITDLPFLGAVSGLPVPTEEWFSNSSSLQEIQIGLDSLCSSQYNHDNYTWYVNGTHDAQVSLSGHDTVWTPKRKKTLLIYQRDQTRRLSNVDFLVQHPVVQQHWEVVVVEHSDRRSMCDLYQLYRRSRVDVFLTTHGFQLSGEKRNADFG